MFSKACEYAIRCTIFIASKSQEGYRTDIKEIAEKINSPAAFTAKILQKLVKENIVHSIKGHNGGFEMTGDQLKLITVQHIVKAIDGDNTYNGCFMGLSQCSENKPCPLHHKYKQIRSDFKSMITTTTIEELVLGLKNGDSFLAV